MKPSLEGMLEEMGLSPVWVLRDSPEVVQKGSAAKSKSMPRGKKPQMQATDGEVRTMPSVVVQTPERPDDVEEMGWQDLYRSIHDCRACGLCNGRKQAVPGIGDGSADWLFIGEGPGAEEDMRGEPFVGQAGKLLDAMLSGIDLKRGEDVYIANAVKCRPPGNRTPDASEMAACFPFLQRQIILIQPKLIILLGRAAVHAVLGQEGSLASLRGKNLTYRNGEQEIPVLVTYHPAYLLRNLPDKAKAWEDLCHARKLMHSLRE